jgi:hypothetical protein
MLTRTLRNLESTGLITRRATRWRARAFEERRFFAKYKSPPKGKIQIRSPKEGHMCPVCIVNTAMIVAGAGSTGGILAVCIGKFRKLFKANRLGLFQTAKEK